LLDSSDDIYTNIGTKFLLSRIYYEQNELDALAALLDSFKKILTRKQKILGYQYTSYKNFVSYMNKLVLLSPYDKLAKETLLEEIENTQTLPDKLWFVKQLRYNSPCLFPSYIFKLTR